MFTRSILGLSSRLRLTFTPSVRNLYPKRLFNNLVSLNSRNFTVYSINRQSKGFNARRILTIGFIGLTIGISLTLCSNSYNISGESFWPWWLWVSNLNVFSSKTMVLEMYKEYVNAVKLSGNKGPKHCVESQDPKPNGRGNMFSTQNINIAIIDRDNSGKTVIDTIFYEKINKKYCLNTVDLNVTNTGIYLWNTPVNEITGESMKSLVIKHGLSHFDSIFYIVSDRMDNTDDVIISQLLDNKTPVIFIQNNHQLNNEGTIFAEMDPEKRKKMNINFWKQIPNSFTKLKNENDVHKMNVFFVNEINNDLLTVSEYFLIRGKLLDIIENNRPEIKDYINDEKLDIIHENEQNIVLGTPATIEKWGALTGALWIIQIEGLDDNIMEIVCKRIPSNTKQLFKLINDINKKQLIKNDILKYCKNRDYLNGNEQWEIFNTALENLADHQTSKQN